MWNVVIANILSSVCVCGRTYGIRRMIVTIDYTLLLFPVHILYTVTIDSEIM